MAEFELVNHKFPNQTTLHIHLCGFQIIHGMKQCINYHNNSNSSKYLPQLELLWSHDICSKLAYTKILVNFWLALVHTEQHTHTHTQEIQEYIQRNVEIYRKQQTHTSSLYKTANHQSGTLEPILAKSRK